MEKITKQTKLEIWADSLSATQKQLKIAQSIQIEALSLLKSYKDVEIQDKAKILSNLTIALSKAQEIENRSYDRIKELNSNYPY